MAIEPVYATIAEALVTCSSLAHALEILIEPDPKAEELDPACKQLADAPEGLVKQYDHIYAQLANAREYLLGLYNDHMLAQRVAEDGGQRRRLEPQPGPPAEVSALPLLEDYTDLEAFCTTKLPGLRTAIYTLTQVLEEIEAKNAEALLNLIQEEKLSSRALNLILSRFVGKKTECDIRFAQVKTLYIDLTRMSEVTVKAKVTADSFRATTEGMPTDAEMNRERQRAWEIHQDKLQKARKDMDDETENCGHLTEKIKQLEAMIQHEMPYKNPSRQTTMSDTSDYNIVQSDDGEGSDEDLEVADSASESTKKVANNDSTSTQGGACAENHGDNLYTSTALAREPIITVLAIRSAPGKAAEDHEGAHTL